MNASKLRSYLLPVTLLAIAALATTCGDADKKGGGGKVPMSKVEQEFHRHAQSQRIPVRMLMAAAFTESKMNAAPASAVYTNGGNETNRRTLGFALTENAFGIPQQTLGLVGHEQAHELEVQIEHYAKWIRAELDAAQIELNPAPATPAEKFQWIWQLAQLHRRGEAQRRNVRVVFARNLIETLNQGDVWQDPRDAQILELKKEQPAINVEDFDEPDRRLFQLRDDSSQIGNNARQFELTTIPSNEQKNQPTRIHVIHCPLNLSACLELQNPARTGDSEQARLRAHYVIPPNQNIVEKPLQVTPHENVVEITDNAGKSTVINDAIVIMLVGQSGRYVEGIRTYADPTWFSSWQLSHLGVIVSAVCTKLKEKNEAIDFSKCVTPNSKTGVTFQHQSSQSFYQWGDIPDYDETIFWAYLSSDDYMINGEATLRLASERKAYQAGEQIPLKANFQVNAKLIQLERAVRCTDQQQKLVWAPVHSESIRSKTTKDFTQVVFDGGPNDNGRHFYRLLIYDAQSELIGWSMVDFYLTKFEPSTIAVAPKACIRSGT